MSDEDDTAAIVAISIALGLLLLAGAAALIIAFWNYPGNWSAWYPHHAHDVAVHEEDDHHHHVVKAVVIPSSQGSLSIRPNAIATAMV